MRALHRLAIFTKPFDTHHAGTARMLHLFASTKCGKLQPLATADGIDRFPVSVQTLPIRRNEHEFTFGAQFSRHPNLRTGRLQFPFRWTSLICTHRQHPQGNHSCEETAEKAKGSCHSHNGSQTTNASEALRSRNAAIFLFGRSGIKRLINHKAGYSARSAPLRMKRSMAKEPAPDA